MKHFASFLLVFLIKTALFAQVPQALNTLLLDRWDDDTLPVIPTLGLAYNSCWGWADAASGREFAALGSTERVHFFEVTGGAITKLIDFKGKNRTVWREFKSIGTRLYSVCDGCQEGLMIFNLSNPDNIQRTYFDTLLFKKSHSIMVDTVSKRVYLNGSNIASSGIAVLDVSQNPDQPVLLATTNLALPANQGGYVHDSYVRNDTVYASHGYGGFVVWDFKTNPSAPISIASINTGGYNHQSWMTLDGRYLAYAEEVPAGKPIRILDMTKLAQHELEVVSEIKMPLNAPKDSGVIYHNLYIKGHYLYAASYMDGLQVFDISDPTNPTRAGYYDTFSTDTIYKYFPPSHPSGGSTVYAGCWGAYPWLPSGNLLASDMQNGLFVIKPTFGGSSSTTGVLENALELSISPNPASAVFSIDFGGEKAISGQFSLFFISGKQIKTGVFENEKSLRVSTEGLADGLYFLNIKSEDGKTASRKVVVLKN